MKREMCHFSRDGIGLGAMPRPAPTHSYHQANVSRLVRVATFATQESQQNPEDCTQETRATVYRGYIMRRIQYDG